MITTLKEVTCDRCGRSILLRPAVSHIVIRLRELGWVTTKSNEHHCGACKDSHEDATGEQEGGGE